MKGMRAVWLVAALSVPVLAGSCSERDGRAIEKPTSPSAEERAEPTLPTTIEPCNLEGPRVLQPAEGAVLSGIATISAQLLENPCFIAATTFVSVFDESGTLVHLGCDNGLPAEVRWDTLSVKNGRYSIRAQRGCGCNRACAEFGEVVHVLVQNGRPEG